MNTIKLLTLSLLLCSAGACSKDDDTGSWPQIPNEEVSPISPNNRVVYEVNLRNYSAEGNFKGLEQDLPRLRELGIDILWLMPVHPIGVKNRIGTKGSPYSVKDYKAINPDYGTADDFKSLVKAAHASGMEIWMDWVANHTAWDHPWATSNLAYYAVKDGRRPYSPEGWADVAQLDYKNKELRAAMIDAMSYWVREFDIDGYRCDAATYVPLTFWKEARAVIDPLKKITWLCEGENPAYMQVFDYDYAWDFNNRLNAFGESNNVKQLVSDCNKLASNNTYADKGRMVYLTNHDLNNDTGSEQQRYGANLLPLTVLYFTVYDMPLIYNGQEVGMNKRMNLFEVSPVEWKPVNETLNTLLKRLTQLKRTQPALEDGANRGTLKVYPTNNDQVFVYSRKRGTNEVLIMLNLSPHPVSFSFSNTTPQYTMFDYLGQGSVSFSLQSELSLPANGYAVYVSK